MLARYATKATQQIKKALDWIFAYLKATKHYALHFRAGKTVHRGVSDLLYGYTDASDCDCPFTRRSTGGYTVYFNECLISWASNLQKLVTLRMCESEYVQMTLTIKDMLFHKETL
eukprot:2816302-Rhodomonas_salina.1